MKRPREQADEYVKLAEDELRRAAMPNNTHRDRNVARAQVYATLALVFEQKLLADLIYQR